MVMRLPTLDDDIADISPPLESATPMTPPALLTPTRGMPPTLDLVTPPGGTPAVLSERNNSEVASELRALLADELALMRRDLAQTAAEHCTRALEIVTTQLEDTSARPNSAVSGFSGQKDKPQMLSGAWVEKEFTSTTSNGAGMTRSQSNGSSVSGAEQHGFGAHRSRLQKVAGPIIRERTPNTLSTPTARDREAISKRTAEVLAMGRGRTIEKGQGAVEKFQKHKAGATEDLGTTSWLGNGSTISGVRKPHRRAQHQNQRGKPVFANASDMKEKIMKDLHKEQYKTENFYKTDGRAQEIARSQHFEHVTLAVICFNAMWIGIDTDQNDADLISDAAIGFQLIEHLFCFFFTGELVIRFAAFEQKCRAFRDKMFIFDFTLLLFMIFETWIVYIIVILSPPGFAENLAGTSALSLFRMLRLIRTARLGRLLRTVPELMILIKGVAIAARSVFWTLCLLLLLIYVFAIGLMILSKDTPIEQVYFKSLGRSMSTLTLYGLLPDSADYVYTMDGYDTFIATIFTLFIIIGLVTVMNLLVGVLVEVVGVVAKTEREQMAVNFVKEEMNILVETELDRDSSGMISKSELEELLLSSGAARIIDNVGVDIGGLVDLADYHLFKDGNNVPFSQFVELVLQLRGTNNATVRDIIDMRKFIMQEMVDLEDRILTVLSAATGRDLKCLEIPGMEQVEGPQRNMPRGIHHGAISGGLGLLRATAAVDDQAVVEEHQDETDEPQIVPLGATWGMGSPLQPGEPDDCSH